MTRPLALALTVATGFSGLVYEVTWQKFLATLLGSHSEATAAVLALFLGGLAVGYAVFGRFTARRVARAAATGQPPRLLVAYGVVEAGLGVWALAFPALFAGVRALSLRLPHGSEAVGFGLDVALAALLVAPPAVLMGGTIPVLTQALSRDREDASRLHALVYGVNTAGAFAGALAAGFVLIPWLGLVGVLRAMAAVNLLAGASFVVLGLRGAEAPARAGATGEGARVAGLAGYLAVACLVGFAMMAAQTVLIRVGGLAFGASQFTFSMVVAVFVLCIALGSFAVSALPRIGTGWLVGVPWALVALLMLLDGALPDAGWAAHAVRSLFGDSHGDFAPFWATAFGALLLALGPAVILSGALLPLLFHHLRREVGELGAVAGAIYGWNTLGSLLGALLGGYALLFWLDLHGVFRVAVVAAAVAAAILTARLGGARGRGVAAALLATSAAIALLRGPWPPEKLAAGTFHYREATGATWRGPDAFFRTRRDPGRIVFYDDDPILSAAVKEYRHGRRRSLSIVNNGKVDSNSLADYPTMGLAATLSALFAERMERAFVVGFGTGVTVGELLSIEGLREVVVAEISPGVLEAAPLFDFANHAVTQDPRARLVRRDAYRALLHSEGAFDVIVSEPSNPWLEGVEMLYSLEFLEAARARLRPGGVYCQWFHLYETDAAALSLVLRTYTAAFDEVAVWYGLGHDLLILGFEGEAARLDLAWIEARLTRPDLRASLARSGVRSLPALLAHELVPLGTLRSLRLDGPLHTLTHPRLSHAAARAFFRGHSAELPFAGGGEAGAVARERSLWRELEARPGGTTEEQLGAFAREVCRHRSGECVAALAHWRERVPGSEGPARLLAERARRPLTDEARVEADQVEEFRALFYDPVPDAVTLETARRASALYRAHYFHAVAPPAEALLALWERCVAPDGAGPEACAAGQADAARLAGADDEAGLAQRP